MAPAGLVIHIPAHLSRALTGTGRGFSRTENECPVIAQRVSGYTPRKANGGFGEGAKQDFETEPKWKRAFHGRMSNRERNVLN